MRLNGWIKDNSGFSLVEVMLALAILALVTLPLVNYYTYSSVQTIDGRERQTATMAAEDVMEELKGYSNYDQIEKLVATATPSASVSPSGSPMPSAGPVSPSAWKIDSSPLPDYTVSPSASPAPLDMMRNVEINGFEYLAKVHFDFDMYDSDTRTVSGAAISYLYNDYYIPKPSEVYSENNVVASEDDEVDSAVSEIYTDLMSTGTSPSAAPSSTLAPVPDSDSYVVRVYYRYSYDSAACASGFASASDKMQYIKENLSRVVCIYIKKTSDINVETTTTPAAGVIEKEVTLEETEISIDKLQNIFVFYKPAWDSANVENFYVKFGTGIEEDDIKKLNFYLTYQDMSVLYPGESPQPGVSPAPDASNIGTYKLRLTGDTTKAAHAKFYSNLNRYDPDNSVPTEGFVLQQTDAGKWNSYVSKKQKKRIGKIYVDIFEPDEDVFSVENALAHMESTFAE